MIFRVFGKRDDGADFSVDIECDSEAVARNEALRLGLVNTMRVEVVSPEALDASSVHAAPGGRRRGSWPRPMAPRTRGTHWGIAKAFEIGFGFGLGLAAACLVVGLAYWFVVLLLSPFVR